MFIILATLEATLKSVIPGGIAVAGQGSTSPSFVFKVLAPANVVPINNAAIQNTNIVFFIFSKQLQSLWHSCPILEWN